MSQRTIVYLSHHSTIESTTRILVSWLEQGIADGTPLGLIVSERGKLTEWAEARGIPSCAVGTHPFGRANACHLLLAALQARLWMGRHQRIPQIIHCNDHNSYRLGATLRTMTGAAAVCHVRFVIGRAFAEWAFGGARCPDALLWTSQSQRNMCADAVKGIVPEANQMVVPLGIDPTAFVRNVSERAATRTAWGVEEADVVLGMACHFEPRKRIEDFIRLIHGLRRNGQRVRGVVAGALTQARFHSYERSLHDMTMSLAVNDVVQFLGRVDPIQRVYEAVDMFVSTSEMETFGNSICEAMAYGLPVVAYDGGSVPEVVGTCGVLVKTGDVAALIDATGSLVDDASARRRLGEQGHDRVVAEMLPNRQRKRLGAVYEAVLSNARRNRTVAS